MKNNLLLLVALGLLTGCATVQHSPMATLPCDNTADQRQVVGVPRGLSAAAAEAACVIERVDREDPDQWITVMPVDPSKAACQRLRAALDWDIQSFGNEPLSVRTSRRSSFGGRLYGYHDEATILRRPNGLLGVLPDARWVVNLTEKYDDQCRVIIYTMYLYQSERVFGEDAADPFAMCEDRSSLAGYGTGDVDGTLDVYLQGGHRSNPVLLPGWTPWEYYFTDWAGTPIPPISEAPEHLCHRHKKSKHPATWWPEKLIALQQAFGRVTAAK